jgi:hypothetical protein
MNKVMNVTRMAGMLGFAAIIGCDGGDETPTLTVGAGAGAGECSLTLDSLTDTEWLYLRANPDKSETPDVKTRLKFVQQDGNLVAKYNVGSLSDMYDYTCSTEGEELVCKQEANAMAWCQARLADGKECDAAWLKAQEGSLTDEEINEAIKKANEDFKQYKGTPREAEYQRTYNSMGNKLRGVLYIKIDARRCRLRVQDMYRFYYNGNWGEDSNPAGINPFVKNEEGELLWEHCDNPRDLVDLASAEFPSDPANVLNKGKHEAGKEVHYWFLSGDYAKPEDGCTYSYDLYKNNKPTLKGQKPEEVEVKGNKQLRWHFAETYAEESKPGEAAIMTMVVDKACTGKEAVKVVTCNALLVTPAAAGAAEGAQ